MNLLILISILTNNIRVINMWLVGSQSINQQNKNGNKWKKVFLDLFEMLYLHGTMAIRPVFNLQGRKREAGENVN
jgi:hypothetical protein